MTSEVKFEERLLKALEDPRKQEALAALVERLDLVKELIDQLWELKRSGVLDDLIQVAAALRFLTEGVLTREFMERLMKLQESLIIAGVNLGQDVSKLDCLTSALVDAEPRPIGLLGLLNALRDEDTQMGLGLLVSMLKNLGSCIARKRGE